jgi:hypothetical protein
MIAPPTRLLDFFIFVLSLRGLEQSKPHTTRAEDEMPDKALTNEPASSSRVTITCNRRADE